mgnify:CR=1 FL=1
MTSEFYQNAKGFELSRQELDAVFSDLREIALEKGTSRELTGLQHENGVPLEYSVPIDPGTAQELFHPHDRSLCVEEAILRYQMPSPTEPDEDDTIREYISLTIEAELLASDGITIQEFFVIEKTDDVTKAYIDVNYLDQNSSPVSFAEKHEEPLELSVPETVLTNLIDIIELNRPLMLNDLEALRLLHDALSA